MPGFCSLFTRTTPALFPTPAFLSNSLYGCSSNSVVTHRRFVTLLGQHADKKSLFGTVEESRLFDSPIVSQQRWKKKKILKKSRPRSTATAEQLAIRPKRCRNWRLTDIVGTPEPTYKVATDIRKLIAQKTKQWRVNRDWTTRNRHRLYRKVGFVPMNTRLKDDDAIVTPLTQLQHLAQLPKSINHVRFPFTHSLHYEVYWGPPQTYEEPNQSKCHVSIKLSDLKLTAVQQRRLLDVIGKERHDEQSNMICLESDEFDNRNHNAAYLGDILQRLLIEVKQ